MRRKLPHVRSFAGDASGGRGGGHRFGPDHGHGKRQAGRSGRCGSHAPVPRYGRHRWHDRHRRRGTRRSAHAVHWREGWRAESYHDHHSRYRGRSVGGHESLRHGRSWLDHGACGVRTGRSAACSRLLHGEDRGGAGSQGGRGPRSAGKAQPQGNCASAATRHRRPGGGGSRPATAPEAHRRHPRGGRAHPADFGWRPVRGDRGSGCGNGCSRRDGLGRRARGGADRRGIAVPQRRDSRPAGGERRCAEGTHAEHGHPRYEPDLHHAGTRAWAYAGVCCLRRDGREPAAGRTLHRRRDPYAIRHG